MANLKPPKDHSSGILLGAIVVVILIGYFLWNFHQLLEAISRYFFN